MEELIRTPFVREVAAICVDPSPSRPPLPAWLKSVPALVVVGEDTPRIGPGPVNNWLFERKLGGGGAMKASSAMEDRRTPLSVPVYNPDMAPRPAATGMSPAAGGAGATARTISHVGGPASAMKLPAPIKGSTPMDKDAKIPTMMGSELEGPEAYHETEMSGGNWSDSYSFLKHEGYTAEKGYDPISRNFESLVAVDELGHGRMGGGAGAAAASAGPKSAKEEALLREFEAYTAGRDRDIAGPIARR